VFLTGDINFKETLLSIPLPKISIVLWIRPQAIRSFSVNFAQALLEET